MSTATGESRPDAHLPALDGVRGIAVALVVALHFIPVAGISGLGSTGRLIEAFTNLGGIGVDVFFVLSGFLITGILLRTREQPHYFRFFYARRTLRIFPLYYLALAITFIVIPAVRGSDGSFASHNQAWLWLYGTNFLSAYSDQTLAANGVTLNHFWSLAVEEQFYLLWPALIFICRRPRNVAIVATAMIIVAFVARPLEYRLHGLRAINMLTWCKFDALAVGALISVARSQLASWPRIQRALITVGTLSTLVYVAIGVTTHYRIVPDTVVLALATFSLQYLIGAGIVAYALRDTPPRFLISPLLQWLGQRSYGIYVYHGMLRIALAGGLAFLSARMSSTLAAVLALAGGLVVTALISELSYRFFEAPINSLKRYFVHSPMR